MKLISKSRFLEYLECPKDAWFRLHQPDLEEFIPSFSDKCIMDQGNLAEEYAQKLKIFKGFVEVKERGTDAKKKIDLLLAKKVPAIYQPTFIADGYIIRCDFLVWNGKTDKWDLYEVKGTNEKKDNDGPHDHITDLCFQAIVLEKCGVEIGKKYIVHLNNEYIRGDKIEVEKLFIANDSTDQVSAKIEIIEKQMELAKKYLSQEGEPKDGCNCHLYGRSRHCKTFKRSHPEVPDYSVHDLSRIGLTPKKLAQLVNDEIYNLEDIEDTEDLTPTQQNQILTHKTNKEIINVRAIAEILGGYDYPLYFFDYETFAPAIPLYPGFKPYQRIPIQFSLHVIEKIGGELKHFEYLHEENSDPSEAVAKKLEELIDPAGTVLAWNDKFEKGVTKEIGERLLKYEKALNRICGQIKDLMDIFSKQHYVHKGFRGKSAVEKVMNVLLPEMSYDHLPYTGNDVGFVWWQDIVNEGADPKDRAKKAKLLKDYCEQDTFVMVEIFRILNDIINKK